MSMRRGKGMYGESSTADHGGTVRCGGAIRRPTWCLIAWALSVAAVPLTAWGQSCPMRCVAGDPAGQEGYDLGKECTTATDCNLCNPSSLDYDEVSCAIAQQQGGICQLIDPCIHLEWRPQSVGASGPGQTVTLGLYAVSSTGFDISFEGLRVLLQWDPTVVSLVGVTQPCTVNDPCATACPANTYKWFSATFPNDCDGDGINAPCPGFPANDGNAYFLALRRVQCAVGEPAEAPLATAAGLHVADFQFQTLSDIGTYCYIDIPFSFGGTTRTLVSGINTAGDIGLGTIGPPVLVSIQECASPTVVDRGSKVIEVDPGFNAADSAILVTSNSPGVDCMSRYAKATGELQTGPVFQSSATWGHAVHLRGRRIMPGRTYFIQNDCGSPGSPNLSPAVQVTMADWADTDENGVVDFTDIQHTVDGFLGAYGEGQSMVDVDLVGNTDPNPTLSRLYYCTPNNVIDFNDIAAAVDAFLNPDPYPVICDTEFCN